MLPFSSTILCSSGTLTIAAACSGNLSWVLVTFSETKTLWHRVRKAGNGRRRPWGTVPQIDAVQLGEHPNNQKYGWLTYVFCCFQLKFMHCTYMLKKMVSLASMGRSLVDVRWLIEHYSMLLLNEKIFKVSCLLQSMRFISAQLI